MTAKAVRLIGGRWTGEGLTIVIQGRAVAEGPALLVVFEHGFPSEAQLAELKRELPEVIDQNLRALFAGQQGQAVYDATPEAAALAAIAPRRVRDDA